MSHSHLRAVQEIHLPDPGDAAWVDLPAPSGIRWLISTLAAGDMSLSQQARRAGFFASLPGPHGVDGHTVYALKQVHSRQVIDTVDLRAAFPPVEGDGLLSTDPKAMLSVTVADCLPILLYDRATGALALCHSGWKGTGIAAEALGRMRRSYGARASDVSAHIGPGIGGCCYAVPEERYRLFEAAYGPEAAFRRGRQTYLDLARANVALLTDAGVERITVVTNCTACTPWLSSYRRQGKEGYVGMVAVATRDL